MATQHWSMYDTENHSMVHREGAGLWVQVHGCICMQVSMQAPGPRSCGINKQARLVRNKQAGFRCAWWLQCACALPRRCYQPLRRCPGEPLIHVHLNTHLTKYTCTNAWRWRHWIAVRPVGRPFARRAAGFAPPLPCVWPAMGAWPGGSDRAG